MSDPVVTYAHTSSAVAVRPPVLRVYRAAVTRTADGYRVGGERSEPCWVPQRLAWASDGRPSSLRLRAMLGQGADQSARRIEDVRVAQGDRFRLVEVLSGASGSSQREWFRGTVVREELHVSSRRGRDDQHYEITCLGPAHKLAQKVVLGQWCKHPDRDQEEMEGALAAADCIRGNCWQSYLPAILNEDGKPNASASAWKLDSDSDRYASSAGNGCRTFEPPGRIVRDADGAVQLRAEPWTAYTALRSLVEWVDAYEVISYERTAWDAIEELLGEIVLGEIDLHGLTLTEAMRAVLEPHGFGYALEPWAGTDSLGRAGHRLRVYSLSDPAARIEPVLAGAGGTNVAAGSDAARQAEVQSLHFVADSRHVANEVHVLGDQKRVQVDLHFGGMSESSWDLHPYWDTSEHALTSWLSGGAFRPRGMPGGSYTFAAFHDKYDHGGEDYELHRHVFRSFAWNEDAALGGVIATTPELTDLGDEQSRYLRRARPVGDTFTFDDDSCRTRRLPATLWMTLVRADTGAVVEDAWLPVPARLWPDRADVTIDCPTVSRWYPWAHDEALAGQVVPGESDVRYQDLHYLTLLHEALSAGSGAKLLLRLSGSVEADRTLTASASVQSDLRWPMAAQRVVLAPHRFRWRERKDTGVWGTALPADTQDDRTAAADLAGQLAEASAAAGGEGRLVLRHLTRRFAPGVGVPQTAGRRLSLALDRDGSRCCVVTAVVWDFAAEPGKTQLTLQAPERRTQP